MILIMCLFDLIVENNWVKYLWAYILDLLTGLVQYKKDWAN